MPATTGGEVCGQSGTPEPMPSAQLTVESQMLDEVRQAAATLSILASLDREATC